MISVILACAICVLLFKLYQYMVYKPPNFPPGPPRLPFVGCYLFLLLINYNHFQRAVSYLCKFYKSKVVGMYYGSLPMIVATDSETVKTMLNDPIMDGRNVMELALMREPNYAQKGVFFIDGDFWKNQRRFSLRHMRDFGFGRRFQDLERDLNDDILTWIDAIKRPKFSYEKKIIKDGNILLPFIFTPILGNTLIQIFTEHRFSREEHHKILTTAERAFKFQRAADAYGNIFSCLPWMGKWFPGLTKYQILKELADDLYQFIKAIIDEQIQTFDENHERSFLDRYIRKMKEADARNEKSYFEYDQIVMILVDFMLPNLTSVPSAISVLFQLLLLHPDSLKRCQEEIDSVVERGRLPCLDDRINLPYTESAIRESMRFDTPVPSSIIHRSMYPTSFMGYDIPENTVCVPAIHESHMDNTIWNEPENFMPERLLDANGKFSPQKDKSVPFGAGKRLCVGETYSRNLIFLLTTALLQNFHISVPEGLKVPDLKDNYSGLIRIPPDFWLKCTPR